jgi:SAM-dependent methyltransferase
VYTRGVIQALPVADRPHAVESMAALLGEQGTLFAKELPPEAGAYFQQVVARHGLSAGLERVMRLIPPGQITEAELAGLFGAERFEVIATGTSHIHTVNALPDGERIKVPAIYALIRPRDRVSAASRAIGRVDAEDAELHALKQGALAVWSAGDYPALARMHADSGIATARRAGAGPGVRLLDVACGDGNVAIPAARAGASVIALDLTQRMLEHGRARAARENVAIEWVLGDAEELPFADERFDAVTSNFGAVFAPRHAVVAAELARVCRPGDRIVMTAWAPDGFNERLAAVAGAYLPQPEVRQPAVLWADEQHACECFAPTGVKLRFERHVARARLRSVEHALEVGEHAFGPVVLARERLIAEGVWDELRAAVGAEYMAITGQKPGHSTLGGER